MVSVGFGDICPGEFSDPLGDLFLLVLPILGLGFFCGPILTMASSWQKRIPGGAVSLGSVTLALGVSALTVFEGLELKDAIHLSIITGMFEQYSNVVVVRASCRCLLAFFSNKYCSAHFLSILGTTIG